MFILAFTDDNVKVLKLWILCEYLVDSLGGQCYNNYGQFRFDGFLFREEVVIVSKKRNKNKKSNTSRKLQSRRKKTDWNFYLQLIQTAIIIYQAFFSWRKAVLGKRLPIKSKLFLRKSATRLTPLFMFILAFTISNVKEFYRKLQSSSVL